MKPQIHATVGFGGGLLLYRSWDKVEGIFFFLGSVLLDVDHFIDFILRTKCKSLNIKRIIQRTYGFDMAHLEIAPGRKDSLCMFLFHTVEFLSLICLAAVLVKSSALMGFFLGAALHLVLDSVDAKRKKIQKAYSWIEFIIRRQLMKKRGLDPDGVHKEVLNLIRHSSKRPE